MILHPPVLALLLASLLGAATLAWAGVFSVQLLRHWDLASGARGQIELERRTYLVATVLMLVMLTQGFALLLMVFNADRTAPLLVGAMCAFGSFNASVYGFPALYAKMALFFAAIVWLAMHHADAAAPDYPLTRRKYALLLALLLPLALLDAGLSLAYFVDLKAATLTSCCGTAFNPEKGSLGADAAAMDPEWALAMLFGSLAAGLALGWLADGRQRLAQAYGAFSAAFLAIALVTVVSAVSIYVYEHPHHHCPFCLLKSEYGYFGFVLYAPLFMGAACGLASGVLSLRPPASLHAQWPRFTQRLRRVSMGGFAAFGLLCAWAVWRSALRL
ncbi:MAG: hypothetical protein Q8K96_01110 [Rubrivivax sp.]|nr:hypothetical protein [Rubrivivax sp.]